MSTPASTSIRNCVRTPAVLGQAGEDHEVQGVVLAGGAGAEVVAKDEGLLAQRDGGAELDHRLRQERYQVGPKGL